MSPAPVRIIIVGGGTAGWMTAAALSRFLETGYAIHLVESEDIGTVGVGEASIPQISLFNAALGIDEDAFLSATQGTFKLGIEFDGWHKPGDRYMHAFGSVGRDVGHVAFHHYWLRARAGGQATNLGEYALNNCAAYAQKMQRGPARTAKSLPAMPYAFHFDAGLYARFLRRYAEAHGVDRTDAQVVDTRLDPGSGHVRAIVLHNGQEIEGDLFIDCSGFRGLLIEQALHAGYDDWSHWLPCDRALAVPCEKMAPPLPYTRATARRAGWQWRIPLQHRTGNGHVYASAFMSDDEATAVLLKSLDGRPLADPKPLKFVTGKRRQVWLKNVVAIGLAAGFMEPLESTSIHLVQSAISRLLKMMPGKHIADADAAEFNRQTEIEYARIRDFLILHYKANQRDAEPFWAQCRGMDIPESLTEKIALFRANGHIFRTQDELFTEVGWLQVMVGQGIVPAGQHGLAAQISDADLAEFLQTLEALTRREVTQMQGHADFIAAHCLAPNPSRIAA